MSNHDREAQQEQQEENLECADEAPITYARGFFELPVHPIAIVAIVIAIAVAGVLQATGVILK